MATLFIGNPDHVFHLKDHIQLILGLGLGVVVSVLGFLLTRKEPYAPVAMNELKSKAQD